MEGPTLHHVMDFLNTSEWLTSLCGPRDPSAKAVAWSIRKPCASYTFTINNIQGCFDFLEEILQLIKNDTRLVNSICWSVDTELVDNELWGKLYIVFDPLK
jgi:hypothetical protein